MPIKNYTTVTSAEGVVSISGAGEERSTLQTVGDILISPISDIMAEENQLVQKRTRGYASATHLAVGFLTGEYFGHRRAAKGKGPLLSFLKA